MSAARLLHLLKDAPVVAPPDAATLFSAGTPRYGVLTPHLLDPALPAIGAAQVLTRVQGAAQAANPQLVFGRWLTRGLPAQTIGAGDWYAHTAFRWPAGQVYALGLGFTLAAWRPSTGAVVATLFDRALYPASAQTIGLTGGPTGGTFGLLWDGSGTITLNWNSTAAAAQTTLSADTFFSNAGGVTVTGGPLPGTPLLVTFARPGPQPLMQISTNALTGGASPAPVFSEATIAAGVAGARLTLNGAGDAVGLSRLTGASAVLLAGDVLGLEVWATLGVGGTTATAPDITLLSGGIGQYVGGNYGNGVLTDTDAYLLAPSAIQFS